MSKASPLERPELHEVTGSSSPLPVTISGTRFSLLIPEVALVSPFVGSAPLRDFVFWFLLFRAITIT